MLTEARINEIATAMGTNEQEIKALVEMSPEDASAHLQSKGFAVTAEELIEFGKYITDTFAANGEIGEDQLDQVAGGSVAAAIFVGGVIVGMILNKKNVW